MFEHSKDNKTFGKNKFCKITAAIQSGFLFIQNPKIGNNLIGSSTQYA